MTKSISGTELLHQCRTENKKLMIMKKGINSADKEKEILKLEIRIRYLQSYLMDRINILDKAVLGMILADYYVFPVDPCSGKLKTYRSLSEKYGVSISGLRKSMKKALALFSMKE